MINYNANAGTKNGGTHNSITDPNAELVKKGFFK